MNYPDPIVVVANRVFTMLADNTFGSVGACALVDSLLANHTLTELDLSKILVYRYPSDPADLMTMVDTCR
jgi:hypothetical protein